MEPSTLAAVSIGLGIIIGDYINMFRQEMRMLSMFRDHPIETASFVTLRLLCLFLFTTSVGYLFARDSLCRAFLICNILSTDFALVTHAIALFSFPKSFKSDRKRRIIALLCIAAFFVVMLVCLVLSTVRAFSRHYLENPHCQIWATAHWTLVAIGALVLFNVAVLLHFLQLGYRERSMKPYLLDIVCLSLITLTLIAVLVITPFNVSSNDVDFILRNYIILVITVIDTRLLLKRARESELEQLGGIPLPLTSVLSYDDDDDEVLTMETASLRSFNLQRQSRISRADPKVNRASTPFQMYDRYSYYSATRLDEIKNAEYPVVKREVVVARN